jgi:hypothetical protein
MDVQPEGRKRCRLDPEPDDRRRPERLALARPEQRSFQTQASDQDLRDGSDEALRGVLAAEGPEQLGEECHPRTGARVDGRSRLGRGGDGLVPVHDSHGERVPLSRSRGAGTIYRRWGRVALLYL